MYSNFMIDNFTEVTIGFEEMVYLVLETAGRVVVPVVLLDGELSSDVTVRITTEDGTATGSGNWEQQLTNDEIVH